jgi:hypothetical protein
MTNVEKTKLNNRVEKGITWLLRHVVTRELVCVDVDPRLKSWAGDGDVPLGQGVFVPAGCGGCLCSV